MKLYGLMITKADREALREWCQDQLAAYDAVLCLDGSQGSETCSTVDEFPGRMHYLHERHLYLISVSNPRSNRGRTNMAGGGQLQPKVRRWASAGPR
jgi:hypothetical protein